MLLQRNDFFPYGMTAVAVLDGKRSEVLLDFGILKLKAGDLFADDSDKERAFLLLTGSVELSRNGNSHKIRRSSYFEECPWVMHIPSGMKICIEAIEKSEIVVEKTFNNTQFDPVLYSPDACRIEQLGAGTLDETSARTVRTVFDATNAPYSNMVLGEVINYPGKWSSYPPHFHPHPEIYHFRFHPERGFGFSGHGNDVRIVRNLDTVTISPGKVHPQVSAPGYAMYYTWMIPHLGNNKFGPDSRIFSEEHEWLLEKDV